MSDLLEKIKRLRELEAMATPRRWVFRHGRIELWVTPPSTGTSGVECFSRYVNNYGCGYDVVDADLICESRNYLPEILDVLEDAIRFIRRQVAETDDSGAEAFLEEHGLLVEE